MSILGHFRFPRKITPYSMSGIFYIMDHIDLIFVLCNQPFVVLQNDTTFSTLWQFKEESCMIQDKLH